MCGSNSPRQDALVEFSFCIFKPGKIRRSGPNCGATSASHTNVCNPQSNSITQQGDDLTPVFNHGKTNSLLTCVLCLKVRPGIYPLPCPGTPTLAKSKANNALPKTRKNGRGEDDSWEDCGRRRMTPVTRNRVWGLGCVRLKDPPQ